MKANTLLKKIHSLQSRLDKLVATEKALDSDTRHECKRASEMLNIKFFYCENETIQEITLK